MDFWFADEGVSGKIYASQRPQCKAMRGEIRNGQTMVATKLHGFGRDAQDLGATIKALATHRNEVIFLQIGKFYLNSVAGKMMLTMLAAIAEMERDQLVERAQSGLAMTQAEGKTLGSSSKTTPNGPPFWQSTLPA